METPLKKEPCTSEDIHIKRERPEIEFVNCESGDGYCDELFEVKGCKIENESDRVFKVEENPVDSTFGHPLVRTEGLPERYPNTLSTEQKSSLGTRNESKNHKCELCGYRTFWRSDLRSHAKIHTREKNYYCPVCKYRTAHTSQLNRHMKIHTGENNFHCNLCDYKTAWKHSLERHTRTHAVKTEYCCTLCDFRDMRKVNFVNHMKSHKGEIEYHCAVCEYRVALKSVLDSHLKTHSTEKNYELLYYIIKH